MFTGLIEEVGVVQHVVKYGEAMRIAISATKIMTDVALGDSIAVNGVCLTVTSFQNNMFTADVMPETFRKSTLHKLGRGAYVNLERAMQAGSRFGGHIVQGHVDGTGIIRNKYVDGNAVIIEVQLDSTEQLKYLLPKGSVTIEGVSLTIVKTTSDGFSVSVIPHTLAETALEHKDIGSPVNIECDIIGKYVEHLLNYRMNDSHATTSPNKLTTAYLAEHGFL